MKTIQEPVATILLLTHDWLVMMPMLLTSQHNGTVIYTKLALRYGMFRYTKRCLSTPLLAVLLPSPCNSTTMAVVSQHKPGVKRMVTVWRSKLARLVKRMSHSTRNPPNQQSSASTTPLPTSFLTLPPEIRYEIYGHVIPGVERVCVYWGLQNLPNVLKTASSTQAIREEIRAYYFAKHTVLLNVVDLHPFLSGIRTIDGGYIFAKHNILNSVTSLSIWSDVVELLREVGNRSATTRNAVENVLSCPNLQNVRFEFDSYESISSWCKSPEVLNLSLWFLFEFLHDVIKPVALRPGVECVLRVGRFGWCYRGRHVMQRVERDTFPEFKSLSHISVAEWLR